MILKLHNISGVFIEETKLKKLRTFNIVIGSWIVILINLVSCADLSLVPWFVFVIAATYFVLFNLFPINMILKYKKVGKWKDYLYGEKVYIILSLVAKTLLAWLVFAGIMQP